MEVVSQIFQNKLNKLADENNTMTFSERSQLAEELVRFINENINPDQRDKFFVYIRDVLEGFRQKFLAEEEMRKSNEQRQMSYMNLHNILHVKMAYVISNMKDRVVYNSIVEEKRIKDSSFKTDWQNKEGTKEERLEKEVGDVDFGLKENRGGLEDEQDKNKRMKDVFHKTNSFFNSKI